jgi:hypothetical protein
MKRHLKGAAVALAAVLAVFALLGEGSEDNGSKDKSTTEGSALSSGSGSASSSDLGRSQASPAPLGTTLAVAKGWDVKVNSAVLDANAIAQQANQFNTPEPGSQYVMVNVTVTNNSSDPEGPWLNIKLSLLPTSGVAIDDAFVAGIPDELDVMAQMQPGASATGNLVYEVKSTDVTGIVLLGEPQMTLDKGKDQRFFAIQ